MTKIYHFLERPDGCLDGVGNAEGLTFDSLTADGWKCLHIQPSESGMGIRQYVAVMQCAEAAS